MVQKIIYKYANRYMKMRSASLIIREMQINTMRYHFTPIRRPIIKKPKITSVVEGVGKREHMCTVGGNVNWCSHYGEQYGDSSKI